MAFWRVFLLFLLLARPVLGETVPGGEVRVERSPEALGCPAERELVQAALALGTPPEVAPGAPQSIFVRFDADASSLRALVKASGRKTGDRELRTEGTDCTKLSEATAVVVAVLLDLVPPEAVASFEASAHAPAPAARAAPQPRATPAARPSRPPAPPPRSPATKPAAYELALRADGAVSLGLLGGVISPLLGGSAAVRHAGWEAALGGAWVAPRRVPFEIDRTSVELALAFGFAEGCLRLTGARRSRWDTWLCGRLAAGVLRGRGRNFDHDSTSKELWLAAGPGLAARLRLHPVFALRLGLGGQLMLGQRTFVVEGYGEAFESPLVSAALTGGVELTIF